VPHNGIWNPRNLYSLFACLDPEARFSFSSADFSDLILTKSAKLEKDAFSYGTITA